MKTGDVVMLAWMNAEALSLTITTREAHYWSRSRGELWQKGGACHTGKASCFYRRVGEDGRMVDVE